MPRLSKLRLRNSLLAFTEGSTFQINNPSIYDINLRSNKSDQYFNNKECIQCQVLTIDVKHLSCLIYLITKINHLQVLNIRCQNIKWNVRLYEGENEYDLLRLK